MPATLRTEEAKEMHDHAIEFERKLIAYYVKDVLTADELEAIKSGSYKNSLASQQYAKGTQPNTVCSG